VLIVDVISSLDIRSMQNAGIYHVAAQHYFSQPYPITNCVP